MKKLILTLALAAVAAVCAKAQIGVGVGYGTKQFNDNSDNLAGLYVGADYSVPIPAVNGLCATAGLEFAMYSHKTDNTSVKENYLAVPVLFNYAIPVADVIKVVPFAGPTFSYGLSSQSSITALGATVTTDNYDGTDYTQFDILVGGGLALIVSDMVRVNVGYNIGLLDRDKSDNTTLKTSGLHFGVGFLF